MKDQRNIIIPHSRPITLVPLLTIETILLVPLNSSKGIAYAFYNKIGPQDPHATINPCVPAKRKIHSVPVACLYTHAHRKIKNEI